MSDNDRLEDLTPEQAFRIYRASFFRVAECARELMEAAALQCKAANRAARALKAAERTLAPRAAGRGAQRAGRLRSKRKK